MPSEIWASSLPHALKAELGIGCLLHDTGAFVGACVGAGVGASVGMLVGVPVDGKRDGISVGVLVGVFVGERVGGRVGRPVGTSVGVRVGGGVGLFLGALVAFLVGFSVGVRVGAPVFSFDGTAVLLAVGFSVGVFVGFFVVFFFFLVGAAVGRSVGVCVGGAVGAAVGSLVWSSGASVFFVLFGVLVPRPDRFGAAEPQGFPPIFTTVLTVTRVLPQGAAQGGAWRAAQGLLCASLLDFQRFFSCHRDDFVFFGEILESRSVNGTRLSSWELSCVAFAEISSRFSVWSFIFRNREPKLS